MVKLIYIKNREEYNNILQFLNDRSIPITLGGMPKSRFIEKVKKFVVRNNLIFYNDGRKMKEYIGTWMNMKLKEIFLKYHLPGHICALKLKKQVDNLYIGFTRKKNQ